MHSLKMMLVAKWSLFSSTVTFSFAMKTNIDLAKKILNLTKFCLFLAMKSAGLSLIDNHDSGYLGMAVQLYV